MTALDGPLSRFVRGGTSPQDLDLIGRSLKEKWPTDEKSRQAVIDRLMDVAINSPKHSQAMKAARLILMAVQQDRQDTREYVKMLVTASRERPAHNQQVNVFSSDKVDLESIHSMLEKCAPGVLAEIEEEE